MKSFEAEVPIVGAGSTGCVLAFRLREHPPTVVIAERAAEPIADRCTREPRTDSPANSARHPIGKTPLR